MRLSWQITLLVTVLMVLVLLSTIYISIHGSRQYLVEQMQIQAQDAGGSLAMTIAPILSADEVALAGAMIDSSFERGHYRKIAINDMDGKTIHKREIPIVVEGVPDWFISFASVESPVTQSLIVDGVAKLASIEVIIHPGNAYRALWQMTLSNMKWISALAMIGMVAIWLIVTYALRPLSRIKRQALDIARQNYTLHEKLPYARELKQLMIAMNDMAEKLEILMAAQMDHVIELDNELNTDPATGVLSRKGFDDRLIRALQQDANQQGQIILIRICGLERVNQFFSYKRGNEELKKVFARIKELSIHEWEIGRFSGADIVIFIPDGQSLELDNRCEQLVAALNSASEDLQCRIGAINVTSTLDKEQLLQGANMALQKAMDAECGWYVVASSPSS